MVEKRLALAFPIMRKMDDGNRIKNCKPDQWRSPPDNEHCNCRTKITPNRW